MTHIQNDKRRRVIPLIAGLVVMVLVSVLLWSLVTNDDHNKDNASASQPQSELDLMVAGFGCNVNDVATRAMLNQGFTDNQFVIGEDQVNWSESEANERGGGAFQQETPKSADEVVDQLIADTEASQAAMEELLTQSEATNEQLHNPDNWVAVQFTVESTWAGNTALKGGEAVSAGTRQSAEGDVAWLFVHPAKCQKVAPADAEDGEVPVDAIPPEEAVTAHRAGCGNPQTELPTPPGGKKPPTKVPPGEEPPTTTTTEKPDTSEECQQNNSLPGCPFPGFTQPPSSNPGQDVGPMPGAPSSPHVPSPGPTPQPGTPTPPPQDGGYDSGPGSPPGGSTCDDPSGCTGGGPTGPAPGDPPIVEDPDVPIGGDDGGF